MRAVIQKWNNNSRMVVPKYLWSASAWPKENRRHGAFGFQAAGKRGAISEVDNNLIAVVAVFVHSQSLDCLSRYLGTLEESVCHCNLLTAIVQFVPY